ncbi:MAG TPA: class I SAM-dependent methyltransferase [Vicinamibacterales bacterium]|nr:class I SAM-dependent methyltransferase [Vicinamibacterales bacterium]
MSEFSAEWLTLREPADHRARSLQLTRQISGRVIDRSPVRVLDLACGTGSNLRYLARHLPPIQHWRMVDRDPLLLARIRKPMSWGIVASVHVHRRDLANLDGSVELFERTSLVTASALLDLVSRRWLDALADRCRMAGAAALFVLSYDGRILCTPQDSDDETVRTLVNQHQRTDKGFGIALGPEAADQAAQCFAARDFVVVRERSDWTLGNTESDLQRQLIEGWAVAAAEIAPAQAPAIDAWRTRRLEHVSAGRSALVVGHEDLAAWIR